MLNKNKVTINGTTYIIQRNFAKKGSAHDLVKKRIANPDS